MAEIVSQKLWLLQLDQLRKVGVEAKIPTGIVTTRRALVKQITKFIDKVIDEEEEDVAMHHLKTMLKKLEQITTDTENSEIDTENTALISQKTHEEVNLAEKYSQLQLNSQALQDEVRRLSERMNSALSSQVSAPLNVNRFPEVTMRREFKISGQIGEKGQKDKLSYRNLMHQIDRGLSKGHSEAEIMEAVIKSISPGLSIRDMLEIKNDLTLSQVKTILKGHFKEDNSTDLYHRLVNITQDIRESPQNFLFRAIELKERLVLASREVDSEEQYSMELIQKKFLRSVSTGLLSDNIKFQLKPYLDDRQVTDEMLIERMNEAASVESERFQKQRKNTISKNPKVNEIQTEMQPNLVQGAAEAGVGVQEQSAEVVKPKIRKTPAIVSSRDSDLYETIRLLREEMAEIRKTINNSQGPTRQLKTSFKRGCKACQEQGIGDQCEHCLKCGQSGHFSRGCRGPRRLTEKPDGMKVTVQAVTPPKPPAPHQAEPDNAVHEALRERIEQLEAELEGNGKVQQIVGATYASHLSFRRQAKLQALIGKKCMVDCFFEGVATQGLWDTGSQVTIINDSWRRSCFPHIRLRNLEELLSEDETLVGKAANQTPIPFAGWAELRFKLGSSAGSQPELLVPVLVSSEAGVAQPPIIGYNVIEQLVKKGMAQQPDVTPAVVRDALSIDCKRANVLIQLVQGGEQTDREGVVKVGRQSMVIPAGQTKEVKCSVRTGPLPTRQEVLFEPEGIPEWPEGVNITETVICLKKGNWSRVSIPVMNNSNHNITLAPCTVLGHLQQVRAIYPVDVRPASASGNTDETSSEKESINNTVCLSEDTIDLHRTTETHQEKHRRTDTGTHVSWDPPVSVDHLTPEQQEKVRKMLREECGVFSRDENDVGCIPSLQLKIRLSDIHLST